MKKKPPKVSRKRLEKDLDELWSHAVKSRDKECQLCGKRSTLNAHHIFTRKYKSTRWNIDNGISLCWAHHIHLAHGEPEKFRDFIITLKGEKFYSNLKDEAYKTVKLTVDDLQAIKTHLEGKV